MEAASSGTACTQASPLTPQAGGTCIDTMEHEVPPLTHGCPGSLRASFPRVIISIATAGDFYVKVSSPLHS